MVQLTDNFIIEVPTMQVEVFLSYLKTKLPLIKNYYYIQEIKKAERVSPIQIMDGINGYYTYSRFVAKITFEGVYLPPCSCIKINSKNYDINTKLLKLTCKTTSSKTSTSKTSTSKSSSAKEKENIEISNIVYVPKQGSSSQCALIDLTNDNIRLIQIELDELNVNIPQNILQQLNIKNLQSLTNSKSDDVQELMNTYIKKQPFF